MPPQRWYSIRAFIGLYPAISNSTPHLVKQPVQLGACLEGWTVRTQTSEISRSTRAFCYPSSIPPSSKQQVSSGTHITNHRYIRRNPCQNILPFPSPLVCQGRRQVISHVKDVLISSSPLSSPLSSPSLSPLPSPCADKSIIL